MESKKLAHLIVVHDENGDWQALYRDGERVDQDSAIYGSDVVQAAQGKPVELSFVTVDTTNALDFGDDFPKLFESLMPFVAEESDAEHNLATAAIPSTEGK